VSRPEPRFRTSAARQRHLERVEKELAKYGI
jgi:hypothetical protein